MFTARLFAQEVDLSALKFYLDGRPQQPFLLSQNYDTLHGLPECENRIPLRSLVFTQYRSVTDRRTD